MKAFSEGSAVSVLADFAKDFSSFFFWVEEEGKPVEWSVQQK